MQHTGRSKLLRGAEFLGIFLGGAVQTATPYRPKKRFRANGLTAVIEHELPRPQGGARQYRVRFEGPHGRIEAVDTMSHEEIREHLQLAR